MLAVLSVRTFEGNAYLSGTFSQFSSTQQIRPGSVESCSVATSTYLPVRAGRGRSSTACGWSMSDEKEGVSIGRRGMILAASGLCE